MRTDVLNYIIEVDKQKSITKAANTLYISQSALSESISQLEEELDCLIFSRSKKGISTTEAGQKIISQAQTVLQELHKLYEISFLSPALIDCHEKISIGLSQKFSSSILNLTISKVLTKYPEIIFDILDMDSSRCIQALEKQEIQIAMISVSVDDEDYTTKILHKKKIRYISLPHEPVIALVNKTSPLAKKTSLKLQSFSEETLISYSSISNVRNSILPVKKVLFLPSIDNIVHLVKLNEGISILPLTIIHDILPQIENELSLIPITDLQQCNYIIFFEHTLSKVQKNFIDIYIQNYNTIFC